MNQETSDSNLSEEQVSDEEDDFEGMPPLISKKETPVQNGEKEEKDKLAENNDYRNDPGDTSEESELTESVENRTYEQSVDNIGSFDGKILPDGNCERTTKIKQTVTNQNHAEGYVKNPANNGSISGFVSHDSQTTVDNNSANEERYANKGDNDEKSLDCLDVLGNGLLMKKILKEGGESAIRPVKGQEVVLKISGKSESGIPVDCHDKIAFILGDGDVIQAWDICVSLMKCGEQCELYSDSKYCYGSFERFVGGTTIPPNTNMSYVLELQSINEGPDIEKMSSEDRISIGDKKRCYGNVLYSCGDYSGAINVYTRALKYLEASGSEDVMKLKVKCWNNLAASQLKIKAYQAALSSCLQVLNIEPNNVKALYRRGKVLALQGEFDEAIVYLKKANALEPSNKTVINELNTLRKHQVSQLKKEKDMYQRMVSGITEHSDTSKVPKCSFFSWPMLVGATVIALGGIVAALLFSKHQ